MTADTLPDTGDKTTGESFIVREMDTSGYDYEASVIVVTYDRDRTALTATFDALAAQTADAFEVVLLDNGTRWDLESVQATYDDITTYVQFLDNEGVNVARNVGAQLATGDLLIFLDDDAIPEPEFVEQHCRAHADRDIVAARGRIKPKTRNVYSRMASRYDLGTEPYPTPIDTEGNFSIENTAYERAGGFNEHIWGHEGIHLTAKLLADHDPESIIYHPGPVVRHEYATGFVDLIEKKARHKHYRQELQKEYPQLFDVYRHFDEWDMAERASLPVLVSVGAINAFTDALATAYLRVASYDTPTSDTLNDTNTTEQ